ncbi:pentatricopeptide repeat-containing protein At2g17210-like [Silene latifolia]|uniref:pentatricopeptide repeat-containing protein At2g17210-like n=1 Tax=Silene latifolia TaxID=37657 RepID=UPI003D77DC8F
MRLPSCSSMRLPEWCLKIKECLSTSNWHEAISCYIAMRRSGIILTDVTLFPAVMKASSKLSFKNGELMHACSIKQGYESFISVRNSTLDFYMKWGCPSSALSVFQNMINTDSVSWNIIIHGYLDHGLLKDGLFFLEEGRVSGFQPNVSTLVSVLQAFRALRDFEGGRKFHGY